jgi:hypothetical protein
MALEHTRLLLLLALMGQLRGRSKRAERFLYKVGDVSVFLHPTKGYRVRA